jgi:cytochrome P450
MRDAPGPGMWETYRRLRGASLRQFPVFLREVASEYGPVVAFRVPWRRFYFVNDPAAIKDLLIAHQHDLIKSEGSRAMRALLGQGLVTSEEPLHRHMRRIVQPAFHKQRIDEYAKTMRDYAQAWRPPPGVFDMHAEMMELTLRIASKTLFGADAGEEADRVGAALRDIVAVFPRVLGPFGALRRRLPFGPMARFRKARRVLDEIVLRLIAQRRRSAESFNAAGDDGSVLSMLLGLDDAQIRDEVMTLFVAGHETTANALTWTWYLLALHPKIARRLRNEVLRDPESPFLDAVLNESLRLYPPAWILGREALRELEAGGWRIRKGATVLISQLVMHRSSEFFENPENFEPERWLRARELPAFAYFPFGGGSRKCIGDRFAWMEAQIELGNLVSRFRFELAADAAQILPDPVITLRPRGPVPMRALTW